MLCVDAAVALGDFSLELSLSVAPEEKVIVAPENEVKLRVIARFSDGSERDVTHFAVYEANNLAATISAEGRGHARNAGGINGAGALS